MPAGKSLLVGASGADIANREEVFVGRVVGMEGDTQESGLVVGVRFFSIAGVHDLIKIEKKRLCRRSRCDVRDEFKVAGFFTNEESLTVAPRAAEGERLGKRKARKGILHFDHRCGRRVGKGDARIGHSGTRVDDERCG